MQMFIRLLIVWLMLTPFSCFATSIEDNQLIEHLVNQAVMNEAKLNSGERIELSVNRLDTRIKLEACSTTPKVKLNNLSRANSALTAEIYCEASKANKPWKLFVTVNIKIFAEVVVAADNIPRGSSINLENTKTQEINRLSLSNGYYTNPETLVGMTAKRNISAGTVINSLQISLPVLIRRGDPVIIRAAGSAFAVQMRGVAKEDGALNQAIAVVNQSSNRIIRAFVSGRGEVKVLL